MSWMSHRHCHVPGTGPRFGFLPLCLGYRPHPGGTQRLPIPTSSFRNEVTPLRAAKQGWQWSLGKVRFCLLLMICGKDLASDKDGWLCPLFTARPESCVRMGEFIPFLIQSLDPNTETSRDLPSITSTSSFSSLCILFPRGQDGSGVGHFYLIS